MAGQLGPFLRIFGGVAVGLAAFATGLYAAGSDPFWLAKHRGLLVRSLLLILVAVPLGAILVLEATGARDVVKAGLTIAIISIGIGPPAALNTARANQDSIAYEVGLNVVLMTLAILYIPAAVALHGAVYHHQVRLGVGQVAGVVLIRAMAPLLLGVIVGRLLPRAVTPLTRYLGVFVRIVLLAFVVIALVASWRQLLALGAKPWLICAGVVIGEIVLGHLAGGADPDSRRMLVAFSAVRFPALALLLASVARRGRELIPVILVYVLTSVILVGIYSAAMSRRERRHRPPLSLSPRSATT